MTSPVQKIIDWYSSLTSESLDQIDHLYAEHSVFKDPFNEVCGVSSIRHIFSHMFETTVAPRFVIRDVIEGDQQVFLTWDFRFELNRREYLVVGATHLRLNAEGKIIMHRDYWDPAEELWQKLPILGPIISWLRGKFRAQ